MTNKKRKLLETLKGYALSDLDLQHILNPDTKIHKYTDLYKIKHIDELFDTLGRCILLLAQIKATRSVRAKRGFSRSGVSVDNSNRSIFEALDLTLN